MIFHSVKTVRLLGQYPQNQNGVELRVTETLRGSVSPELYDINHDLLFYFHTAEEAEAFCEGIPRDVGFIVY